MLHKNYGLHAEIVITIVFFSEQKVQARQKILHLKNIYGVMQK